MSVEVEGRGVVVGEVGELVSWEQYEPDEFVEQVHVREQSVSRSRHYVLVLVDNVT